ncbi:MAG: T9SS type A sorting domain-containing protein, partial [Crocinitomicaceae bacterium]
CGRDKFGSAVGIFGDVAVVGIAFKELKTSTTGKGGAVYTFDFTSSGWTETQQFSHSDGVAWDRFGASCEIWRDRLVVGAPYEDEDDSGPPANTLNDAGSSYIFEITETATQPTITDLSSGASCSGGTVQLAVTGANLNDAAEWQWYEGSCGGTLIGTGSTITFPSPSVTTTYYANGVGGCVSDGLCGSITISPNPDLWPKRYGNSSSVIEKAQAVAVDNSGNVYVHGTVDGTTTFEGGLTVPGGGFLAKYDNCGVLLWLRDISSYGKEYSKLKVDNLGNPILLATTAIPPVSSDIEYHLTKFNSSNGIVQWSNTIEMKHFLPWPSFDIDMSTNEVYLVANVNQYLRISQSNGTLIVNYTAPTSSLIFPKNMSYIIKYTSAGMQVWQDRMYANAGYAAFQDVEVAENTGRAYICGYAGNHPSPAGQIKFISNGSITMSPVGKSKLFITSYATGTGVAQYSKLHPLITGYSTSLQIDYSNMDDQIYVKNFKSLQLFDDLGNFISSAVTFGKSGQMEYDQDENYALICGTTSGQKPEIQKFEGTTNIWTYTVTGGTGYVYGAHSDPTSDQIFLAGSYWNTNLTLSPTDVLTLAGGRDAFISTVTDAGSTVQYFKKTVWAVENAELKTSGDEIDKSVSNESALVIYPNPSNGLFHVELAIDGESSQQEVQVYNTTGKLIYSANPESRDFNIDLSEFDSGLYHLIIKNQDGIIQRKLIKQ